MVNDPKNKSCCKRLLLRQLLSCVMILPAFENSRSEGTEVPTITKYLLAIADKGELTLFQYLIGFSSIGIEG